MTRVDIATTAQVAAAQTTANAAVPRWAPTTAYLIYQQVVSPNNDVVSATVAHTSGASFTPANWTLSSTYAPTLGPRPVYLDAYHNFFNAAGAWVATQGTTSTTLTAQATAGAAVMAVTSGASFVNGTSIITNPGTPTQQIYKVTAGGGTASLTVTPNIVTTLASGATVLPLWTNSSHLTNPEGMSAWGFWAVNAKKADGTYALTDPGTTRPVVLLGDSWASQLGANFAVHVHTRFPAAVVVNVGISGNKTSDMIARFATDVPTNAAFVFINEPGVNDVYAGLTQATFAANLATLVALIRGIGAVPIITGMVPLLDYPGASSQRADEMLAQVGDGTVYPALTTQGAASIALPTSLGGGVYNLGIGALALTGITTGGGNVCIGSEVAKMVTTGSNNTALGALAMRNNTGGFNTVVGQGALSAAGSAGSSTAIGANALISATGTGNTAVGKDADYSPNGVPANATTTASYQTALGYQAGCSPTGSYATAIGANAVASGYGSTALGQGTLASALGSVAIGRDSAGTGASSATQDEMGLGTALHRVKVLGRLNVAQRTPTSGADASGAVGDIVADDNYVYAKTSTGWKRTAITTW